jgi:acetoacetyl-CoA synthetase
LDDNFFEVGGTSLGAVRLVNAIHEQLGVDLPVSTLLHARTIEAMTSVIDAGEPQEFPLLVLLKPGTSDRPLFVVHGMYGDVLMLRTLAMRLRTDRPVYGVRARGLDRRAEVQTTVEEMAEDYVRQVRLVQPTGPYALAGHSFGGLVAFEMARVLAVAGQTVDSLTLIDTYVHDGCLTPVSRLLFRLMRPIRMIGVGLRTPRRTLPRVLRRLALRVVPSLHIAPPEPLAEPLPASLRRLGEFNMSAFERYRPAPHQGSATFVKSLHRHPGMCNPISTWTRLVQKRLVVETVSSGHDEMLRDPNVHELADLLVSNLN